VGSKIVRMISTGNQFRVTIPREIALESGLYMSEFVEITTIKYGTVEVKEIEFKNAKKKGIPADPS
jgi:hypothetical protein